jgi:hypothetical protein
MLAHNLGHELDGMELLIDGGTMGVCLQSCVLQLL